MRVHALGQEDPPEKGMATHFSILAWRIPWIEEAGGLQSTGSQQSDTTERLGTHDAHLRFEKLMKAPAPIPRKITTSSHVGTPFAPTFGSSSGGRLDLAWSDLSLLLTSGTSPQPPPHWSSPPGYCSGEGHTSSVCQSPCSCTSR